MSTPNIQFIQVSRFSSVLNNRFTVHTLFVAVCPVVTVCPMVTLCLVITVCSMVCRIQHTCAHVGNCFTGLCTKCTGYNNLVIAACCSGTSGVAVERFDCTGACCSGTGGVVVKRFDCVHPSCFAHV